MKSDLDRDMDASADAAFAIVRARLQSKGLDIPDDEIAVFRVGFAEGAAWVLQKIKVPQ